MAQWCWVWDGHIEDVRSDVLCVKLQRRGDVVYADILRDEIRPCDRHKICRGAIITWYTTINRGNEIRFTGTRLTPSMIARANRDVRIMEDLGLFTDEPRRNRVCNSAEGQGAEPGGNGGE